MMQNSLEKSSLAWFKLADYVNRKEKERALGLYRLLTHSINDVAFSTQLEADLLRSFHDEKALHVYVKAATLYEKSNRFLQAALLYEQCAALAVDAVSYYYQAIRLYVLLAQASKITKLTSSIISRLKVTQQYSEAFIYIEHLAIDDAVKASLFADVLCSLAARHSMNSIIKDFLHAALRCYEKSNDTIGLSRLLATLQATAIPVYTNALDFLNQDT